MSSQKLISAESLASEARIASLDDISYEQNHNINNYRMTFKPELIDDLYFITYKYQEGKPEDVTHNYYSGITAMLNGLGLIKDYCYENDSQGRLHYHCIFKSRKNLYVSRLFRKKFTCKVKNVYDEDKLKEYIHKCTSVNCRLDNKAYMF